MKPMDPQKSIKSPQQNRAQQDHAHILWDILYLESGLTCSCVPLNTLRPRQNGLLFTDDTFKRISLNENILISIKISLNLVPKIRISNIPTMVQIMAWRRPGNKPLSEPMMICLLAHICVTRPQWVNTPSDQYLRPLDCENTISGKWESASDSWMVRRQRRWGICVCSCLAWIISVHQGINALAMVLT